MKILIEVPTWLGDAVMTTPAIENLIHSFPDAKITLFGSFISTQALKAHPNVSSIVEDTSKKKGFRLLNLFKLSKNIGQFDLAFSFRRTLTSKLFLLMVNAKKKHQYKRISKELMHQVMHYNLFMQHALNSNFIAKNLTLYFPKKSFAKPTIGINPGASYGSAKRWIPQRFALVASSLSKKYNIIIFGGPTEVEMADEIEKELQMHNVTNYTNLAGKTTIPELLSHIAGLDFFITNDSGPMHVAAAYNIPSVCIFGPTKHTETSQWMNPHSSIVRVELECAPCMKRVCPLKTDECMNSVSVDDVLQAVKRIEDAL
ncbi:MAG TPA: glycosyltransferase family 9 protein [Sulfurospirillum arcachonense]|nr:glycosyltransferase family 9 protein [Sulfurospirillum arcachonense]HIP44201.1 glycosyltransferase family 9 protein [Sulfurospirillum arcachonense]